MTQRFVVIGNPVAHSKSPDIHRMFAEQTGLDIEYTTLLAPLDGFAEAVRAFRDSGGSGANVTVPFKEQAFELGKRHTARARAAGAVNTLIFNSNRIMGDNTDGAGLVQDLKGNLEFPVKGKRVLLVGAGGAARGVLLSLLDEVPASVTIVNRTVDKARQLAREFSSIAAFVIADPALQVKGGRPPQLPLIGGGFDDIRGREYDLVINATSTGLSGEELPLENTTFAQNGLAYDMMYGRETPFMQLAASTGVRTADGLGMLVEQAAESFHVWLGVKPETATVLEQLRRT